MPALLALAQQQGVPPLASRDKALHRRLGHHITDCLRALTPALPRLQYLQACEALHRWALGSEHEVSRLWVLVSLLHSRAASFVGASLRAVIARAGSSVQLPKYVALVQAVQVVGRVLDVPEARAS